MDSLHLHQRVVIFQQNSEPVTVSESRDTIYFTLATEESGLEFSELHSVQDDVRKSLPRSNQRRWRIVWVPEA